MSDIWKNPLMWGSKNLDNNKDAGAAENIGFSYDEIEVDALDQIINKVRIDGGPEKSDASSLLETPAEEPTDLRAVFADLPIGNINFGSGVAAEQATAFDMYNAISVITESGGAAERLGIGDGVAIESGVNAGMSVKDAVDLKDTLKIALSLLKIGDGEMPEDLLGALQDKAKSGDVDGILEILDQAGTNLPENISGTDVYYLALASMNKPDNLAFMLRNL